MLIYTFTSNQPITLMVFGTFHIMRTHSATVGRKIYLNGRIGRKLQLNSIKLINYPDWFGSK